MQTQTTTSTIAHSSSTETMDNRPFTILRIKRKRTDEPLDALVIDSSVRRKKSKGGVGLFQYAETVENEDWEDANRHKAIQDKLSRLAREDAVKLDWKSSVPTGPPAPVESTAQGEQYLNSKPPLSPQARMKDEAASRRYTIVAQEESRPARRFPLAPPKVLSAKELAQKKTAPDFKMYDAVPEDTQQQNMAVDTPSEMDKFLPMLNDYLRIHDMPTDQPPKKPSNSVANNVNSVEPNVTQAPKKPSTDDDYVWDVFYHRPATLSEWNAVANVGTVTGLPRSFGEEYDSASDSEEEMDEADEDSNAEEYYKNDYPEDEDLEPEDSDEFHEHSDYDDIAHYDGPDDDSDF
ncbi:hypothetical protein D9613_006005 [Agrocybe pediades]|uniref:Probable RNA polymerase II nuclear localization protein SLC7A6OS n=1 Tax=Agrocybe pediades TaxID=84607 RepID=A0A8H4VPK7_9AGAR|nr:hypothetical protein D9613_006005 [Agrocybe pediades]